MTDRPLTLAESMERAMSPDHSRKGIFVHHNCWKCKDGELPCVSTTAACEYPHARND